MTLKLLILGGTTEASALARLLAGDARFQATLSLAGRTREPAAAAVPQRIGGFGGVEGLGTYLRQEDIAALLDATHPFAARISANAAAAAERAGVPLLAVRRPGWSAQPGDRWIGVGDAEAAARALGDEPRRVFLTTGRLELAAFAQAPQHDYLVRSVDVLERLPFPRYRLIAARGPFAAADEQRLLAAERIELLVSKNSGGSATYGKLEAARALGLPVVMIERPAKPAVPSVETAEEAFAWLVARHAETATARGV